MKYILLFLSLSMGYALIICNTPVLLKDEIVFSKVTQDDSIPHIQLVLPQNKEFYTWGSQVRYSIEVSDVRDGDSKYGEINGNEVLLEIESLPMTKEAKIKEKVKMRENKPEDTGLSLIKSSTCFGCHADKTQLSGPSFAEIAGRYEKTTHTIKALGKHISEGSSGLWGHIEMPSHPDFTVEETEQIAEYILKQGGQANSWVLPGMEGTFPIKNQDHYEKGTYILTATYTSTSRAKGQHSVVLHIE